MKPTQSKIRDVRRDDITFCTVLADDLVMTKMEKYVIKNVSLASPNSRISSLMMIVMIHCLFGRQYTLEIL